MPAFISYSQKDEAAYTSLCLALEGQHIQFWDPKTMRVGVSLREQLKEGINKCDICIFLATRNSINSEWCLAEIGAFWGAGKSVIVFMADSDLNEDQIPIQFQGDLWTRDVRKVVAAVRAEIKAAAEKREHVSGDRPRLVSEMSVQAFYGFISSARYQGQRTIRETVILLGRAFSKNPADSAAMALPLLNLLIGAPQDEVTNAIDEYWTHHFIVSTDAGSWLGGSDSESHGPGFWGFENCLLIRGHGKKCVAALTVSSIWSEGDLLGYGEVIAAAGSVNLGNITGLEDY